MSERGPQDGQGGWDVGKKIGRKWIIHGVEISAEIGGQQSKMWFMEKCKKGNPHNLTYPNKLEIWNDDRKWICTF